jgi:hypothetical protein
MRLQAFTLTLLAACAFAAAATAAVDPGTRTVTAGAFRVQFSQSDP